MNIVNWTFAWGILSPLLSALKTTLLATVLGMAIALPVGLALTLARKSRWILLSWPARFAVEFLRGTPLLVQLYFLFYVLPSAGFMLSPLTTGVLALGLYYAAYCSEVYRAGIEAIPPEQWQAAAALNFSNGQTLLRIILPQAIPPMVPVLGNYLIAMFKDTPMLSAITVIEVLQQGKIIGSESFRYTEPLTWVALLFLILSLVSAQLVKRLERKPQVRGVPS